MPRTFDKSPKITYPPGCKELTEEQSKDELVRRLKLLARAFQDMGQDENNEYKQLALFLASEFFLDHSNKDVRLLVACCIADIFRIFAPEAPFTESGHLKEIFLFLTQQLRGLDDPEAPSFKRYFYLLENLAWVKSFNICIELEENQEIFCSLYKLIFSIVNEKHSNKVVNFMLDMMCPLIAEADSVSQELLDIIMMNIIEPYKSQNKHAYNLAKDLLRRTANAIEPYIQTFFNNALMLGKSSESEISGRLYELIYELNSIASNVLLAVLPQLEFKLKSSDAVERKAVTRMLSRMFSDPGSDLAVQNKPLWNCYVGRFNDIDVDVRRTCVQACQEFIVNHADLIKDISEPLKQRQHDPDENVRMDVVQTVIGAAKREFGNITTDILDSVKERILDKKFKIRKEALMGLGVVYKKLMQKDTHNDSEKETLSWIRNKIFHAYYRSSLDDRIWVERLLNTALVPYSLEVDDRMRRLYILYGNVDENAVKALQEIFKTQFNVRNIVRSLLELHQREPTDETKQLKINRAIQLARQLPDSQKAQEYMKKFNKYLADDQRIRNAMLKLVGPDCSCKKAEEYVKEVLKKMGNPIPQNYMYTHVKILLERVAPVMIDTQAIQSLLKIVDDSIRGLGEINDFVPNASEVGLQLLLSLSMVYPGCFNNEEVFVQLITFIKHDDDVIVDLTLQVFAQIGQKLETQLPNIHSSLLPILQKLVKIGTPKQAKHAIKCIDKMCTNKQKIFTQIFEHLNKNMDLDSPNFLTSLVGIGHMAQLCPGEFASPVKGIVTKFIVKDLLMQDRGHYQPTSESWCDDRLVSEETKAKVEALKMIVRWLLGIKNNANNSVSSTLRLLYTLILHEGDLMERGKINKAEMARLRLQAGCCMLKLTQEPLYSELVTLEQFQTLALLLNDPCYQVRLQFAQKLHKGLISLRLPLQYLSVFSLAANDPLKERRQQCKNFLTANITKRRDFLKQHSAAMSKLVAVLPEYVLPFTIHLLAHDPDLTSHTDTETLKNIRECLWFIMEPLVKSENFSFTFYKKMLETIKQTQDVQDPESEETNTKLYAVCDLALNLVLTKTGNFVLKDFPAEPVLPKKLYTDHDPRFSNTKVYLPQELMIAAHKGKKITGPPISPPPSKLEKKNTSVKGNALQDNSHSDSRIEPVASPNSSPASSPESSLNPSPPVVKSRGRKPKERDPSPAPSSEASDPPVTKRGRPPKSTNRNNTDPPSRGRGRPKGTGNNNKGSSDGSVRSPSSEKEVFNKNTNRPKRSHETVTSKTSSNQDKKAQGKITDFIKSKGSSNSKHSSSSPTQSSRNGKMSTRGSPRSPSHSRSPQPSGKENAKSKTAVKSESRQAASAPSPKKTAPSSSSSKLTNTKKRTMSSSAESSPAKRSKSEESKSNRNVRNKKNTADQSEQASPRKRMREASSSPPARGTSKRLRGRGDIPSPTESPRPVSVRRVGKSPGVQPAKKAQPVKASIKKSGAVVNGTSDGEEGTPDSRKSSPATQPSPRKKTAALTKAIKEQGEAELNIKRKTRGKKR